MSEERLKILISDVIDVFKENYIDEVIEVIKKGRQGYYGDNFGRLDMIVIRKWWVLRNKTDNPVW